MIGSTGIMYGGLTRSTMSICASFAARACWSRIEVGTGAGESRGAGGLP